MILLCFYIKKFHKLPFPSDQPFSLSLLGWQATPSTTLGYSTTRKKKNSHTTTFPNTVTCFLFHLVVHGLSGKGETDCNLPLFTFIFFWLIEKLLWNVLPLLTSACCFLQKLFFLGTPQSFDEAKKTNMEQTFRSMVFFLCV